MNIFNNNQANNSNNNRNIFNTSQSGQQQQGGQQTTGNNIFANTMNKNVNLISSNNTQQVANPFTQQKPTQQQSQSQQQQQTQSQTQTLLSTQNPSKTNPQQVIPQNPLIADSLYEKYSFTKILQKILARQKLTMQEITFVKHGGQVYFKQDKWKTNHFKTVICKKDHLGFGPQEIIIQGDIPKCPQIDSIFATIIKNFASICETHQMNGYFMMKRIIRSTSIFTKLYQPKTGLGNKVFEVNQNFLKTFYKPFIITAQQQQPKLIIDKDGKTYLQFLNSLITQFDQQWNAYLKIVEFICCFDGDGEDQMEMIDGNGNGESMGRQSRGQGQTSPQRQMMMGQRPTGQSLQRTRHLRFTEFLQTNILISLFQSYKTFSFHQYEAQLKNTSEEMSPARKRYHKMKKLLFFRISELMSGILTCLYSQQMLLEKDPLPIIQVAHFIDRDIEIVHSASLIQPIHEQRYIKNGMNIILGMLPFAAFINLQHCQLLRIYFNQPQIIQKYNKSMSTDYKNGILKMLSQLKTPMFMPIKLWALTQIQHMKIMQNSNNTRSRVVHNQIKQLKQQQITHLTTLWQQYLQKNIKDLTILQQQRWSYLLCTMILTLGIKNMLQSEFLKSILVYYTKNLLKNNAKRFFNLWNEIIGLEKNVSYEKLEDMVVTQNQNEKKQILMKLSKFIIGQFSMFVAGRVFQQILKNDIVEDSFRLMTKLLGDSQDGQSEFTKYLFTFVDSVKDKNIHGSQEQHGNNQPPNSNVLPESSLRIMIFIAQLARQLKLPLFSTKNSQQVSQIQASVMEIPSQDMQVITCFEQQIKFICKLIQVNFSRLQFVEDKLFGDIEHASKQKMMRQNPHNKSAQLLMSETQGLKICIFLCLILGRINLHQVNNIKCLRYIMKTIDTLFNYQQTHPLMIFAISIVFPLDRKNSLLTSDKGWKSGENVYVNHSYFSDVTKTVQQFEGMYSMERLLAVLAQERTTQGEQKRQIQKLHHVISHHINHLIRYTDSIDIPFPMNTSNYACYQIGNKTISTHGIYEKIQKQLRHWQFITACQYMNSSLLVYRPSQWIYTLMNVIKLPQLLPVDVDTIILLMYKMRISTEESPAFFPMMEILRTINSVNILEQLLQCMRPTVVVNKERKPYQGQLPQLDITKNPPKILNQQLANYQPLQQYSQQLYPKQKYSKYQNIKIVQNKNKKWSFHQQSLMIRKLCIFARLIEEVLKVKLQQQFESYTLLTRLEIIEQIFTLLTKQQHMHTYDIEYIEDQQTKKQTINFHAVIVSLLNLYNYQLRVSPMATNRNTSYYLLRQIEKHAFFTLSYQRKYANNIVMYEISSATNEMLLCYGQQASVVNSMFFQSVPYMANDFGVENDQVSLKSCVISIVQLLCEHHTGHLATKCLQNFSYPSTQEKLSQISFNPTMKYLKHDRQKSLIPILFQHIKSIVTMTDSHIESYSRRLQLFSRAMETMSVLLEEELFYNQVMVMLTDLRISFGNLLLMLGNGNQMFLRREGILQSTQVNVYNKLSLFIYKLVSFTLRRYPHFVQKVINNFLIKPTNLLRMLFQRMDKLKQSNIDLMNKKLQLVKSFQSMPNYLMQQRLTKLALYRVTVDILCRVVLVVLQILQSRQIGQLMAWMFKLSPVIVQKSIQLSQQQQQQTSLMLTTLNLIPLQKLIISKQPQENIKTTSLSQQVTQYKYSYRTCVRKYGNNFMYPSHVAFHRLKIYYNSVVEEQYMGQQQREIGYLGNRLQHEEYVRRQLYHIQLINCLKSLKFSTDSLIKTYFQLMNMLSNIGCAGQNLSLLEIQRQLPKVHQETIMFNKYCLENKFSFYHALIFIKPLLSRDESLAKVVADFVNVVFEYTMEKGEGGQQFVMQQRPNNDQNNNTYTHLLTQQHTIFQQHLTTKHSQCFNPDHIIKFLTNILSTTVEYYFYSKEIKLTQSIQPLGQSIKKIVNGLKDKKVVNCTLRVMLMMYESMLVMCEKLLVVERERMWAGCYGNKRVNLQQQQKQQIQQFHLHQQPPTKLHQLNQQLQQHILQSIREILYKCLQKQKPTLYLREYTGASSLFGATNNSVHNNANNNNRMMEIKTKQHNYFTNKQQLIENVSVICGVAMGVLQSVWREKVISQEIQRQQQLQLKKLQLQKQARQQLINQLEHQRQYTINRNNNNKPTPNTTQYINYIIKLLVQNIQSITNPITRIVLFNLCNKFYLTNQQMLVEKWPFYTMHVNVCDQLFVGRGSFRDNQSNQIDYFNDDRQEERDPFWMEKINVIDTYCTLAIVNEKLFTKELLNILISVINIDVQFIKKQKTTPSIGGKSSKNTLYNNNRDYYQKYPEFMRTTTLNDDRMNKKYNLRRSYTMGITIDRLIEYKKLMTAILLTFGQENWHNPNYSPQTNVLFLEVLNFVAIQFKLQRLLAVRRVENRLKGLIVCEGEGQGEERLKLMERQEKLGSKELKMTTYNLNLSKQKLQQQKSSNYYYNKSYHPTITHHTSLSLFQFIAFVHHNQLIYTWLLAVKIGLRQSSIMHEIGGYILQTQTYNQIWTSMMNKINQLYHYYADYVELFVENFVLTKNLTKLYNYVAQQSAYTVQFDGLNVYFDLLQDDYVQTQLIRGIFEYCAVVIQTVRKCRDIEWKCQRNWGKERLACINKCLQLIQKNKVIIGFKQLGLWGKQYNDLRQVLNEELEKQRNFRRD